MSLNTADYAQQMLDAFEGIVYVYDLAHGQNLFTNRRWGEVFGYSSEETQTVGGTFLASIIHPDDLARMLAHHEALASQTDEVPRNLDYQIRRKNGTYAWLQSSDRPFARDADGRVAQILGFAHDITRQKAAEREREESERRFRREAALRSAIIDNAVEGICVCEDCATPPGILFTVWNQRMTEISGYTLDEINRQGWYQTVYTDPETAARAADRMARMRRGENLQAEEWTITRKDGARRTLLISTNVMLDESGAPKVLGVMHDVTERVRLERDLRDAQRMEAIGRLAGAVAHDFNNTLATIVGGASLLGEVTGLTADDRATLDDIATAALRGAELTRQLLTFSRRQRMEMKVLDLSALVASTLRIVARLLGESIRIETQLAPGCCVRGDQGMLDQVVMNLALNARDAMPQGGTLRISLQPCATPERTEGGEPLPEGEQVLLLVQDSGVGIDPAAMDHLFEPFFTTKPVGKGTGMGLATVYGIVRQHEGKITVESTPGAGTTFRVTLPRAAPPVESARPVRVPALARPLRVLLVEDQDSVRHTVARMLERRGHEVWEAGSAEEALRLWAAHGAQISLLLTDVALGAGANGPALAAQLRAQRSDLPVVYISGLNTVLGDLQLEEGHDFLQKPFEAAALDALLAQRFPDTRAPDPR
jgi:two-component system, cell cycle sensor histidine kinase and response regulator CckA